MKESVLPTLSGVSAAAACPFGNVVVTLTGLIPNSVGTGVYQLGSFAPVTFSGTASAQGTFSFAQGPASPAANGMVLKILSLSIDGGETAYFNDVQTTVVVSNPTLSGISIAPACAGSTTTVTLTGLLPNSSGAATYRLGNFPPVTVNGTSDAMGNFTFTTPVLSPLANGLMVRILSLTASAGGCTTNFTNIQAPVVVLARPTLGTVSVAPACPGNSTTVTLSGLIPNSSGTATYKIGSNPMLFTEQGSADASGVFTFQTPVLPGAANGLVVEIVKLETENGCFSNFTNKKTVLSVTNANCLQSRQGQTVGKNNVAELSVYPNPAKDILNIGGGSENVTVEILNIQGQRVLTSTQKEINISNLASGNYIVKVQDSGNNVIVKRIVKN